MLPISKYPTPWLVKALRSKVKRLSQRSGNCIESAYSPRRSTRHVETYRSERRPLKAELFDGEPVISPELTSHVLKPSHFQPTPTCASIA